MFRLGLTLSALVVLAACGDPFDGMDRLSDVDVVASDPAAAALPSDDEIARDGFFGTSAASGEPPVEAAAQTAPARGGGLLGLFRRPQSETDPAVISTEGATKQLEGGQSDAPAASAGGGDAPLELASLPDTATEPEQERGGFFARLTGGSTGRNNDSGMPEVDYGAQIPYGEIARSCASKRQRLGRKVETSAAGYKVFDTNPGATGLRTFYITGFGDGCPRQVTASHVLLGAPSFYEQLHYGPAGQHLAFGETDKAYEKVKGRVCGARRGKPCGSNMRKLERSTFFINTYARPKDNTVWSEMLIHDGEVMATSMKSSG